MVKQTFHKCDPFLKMFDNPSQIVKPDNFFFSFLKIKYQNPSPSKSPSIRTHIF